MVAQSTQQLASQQHAAQEELPLLLPLLAGLLPVLLLLLLLLEALPQPLLMLLPLLLLHWRLQLLPQLGQAPVSGRTPRPAACIPRYGVHCCQHHSRWALQPPLQLLLPPLLPLLPPLLLRGAAGAAPRSGMCAAAAAVALHAPGLLLLLLLLGPVSLPAWPVSC
jgi:hypothetical protein